MHGQCVRVCVCARTALSVRAWVLRGARGACAKRRYRCVPALLGAVGACVCVRVCAGSPRGVRVRAWGISACARCACSCVQGASVSARRACVGCVHRASVRVKDTRAGGVSVHAWSAQCLHRHCLCACVCVRCIWGAWCVPAVVSARRVCVCVHGVSVCVHAAYPCAHGAGCELSVGVRVSWRAASRKAEAQPEMGSAGGEKLGGGGGGEDSGRGTHNAGELAPGVTPLLGQGVPGAAGDRAGVPSSARSPLCRKRRRRKETWRGRAPSSANCRGPARPPVG